MRQTGAQQDLDLDVAAAPAEKLSIVEKMLLAGQSDDLYRMADLDRRERSRLPGGDWKLHQFLVDWTGH